MTHKKIVPTALVLTMLALAACSIASGDGSSPPNRTTVIVPPGSTTINSP